MSYILQLKNEFEKYKIIVNKEEVLEYNKNLFQQLNFMVDKIYNKKSFHNSYDKYTIFNKHVHTINKKNKNKVNYRNIFLKYIGIKNENFISVPSFNNLNKYILYDNNKNKIKKQLVNTITFIFNNKFYKHTKYERELLLQKMIIIILYNLNNILCENGNLTLRIYNFIDNKTLFLLTLLLSHFNYGYILNFNFIYLIGFKKNVNQNLIKNIFNNNLKFKYNINIQPKIQYIINYIINFVKINIEKCAYVLLNDIINLNKLVLKNNINLLLDYGLYNKLNILSFENIILQLLNNNNFYLIQILIKYITEYKIKNVLEVGSSEGIVPLYLLHNNNDILIKSIYNKNFIYKKINNYLKKYTFNLIIGNIYNLYNNIKKSNYELILLYLTNNNKYNIKLLKKTNNITKKNNIIVLNNILLYNIKLNNYDEYLKEWNILNNNINFIIMIHK